MRRALAVAALLLTVGAACGDPNERPKPPPCPPPPDPDHMSVVVGTIGKLHLVESGYPLAKLAEAMAVFKPDLVLVGARVDPFREDRLEDASFEMTYVTWLAKSRGAAVEPIDWFREEDLGKPAPPVEPADEASIEARETEILHAPKMLTFEQANGGDIGEKILLAHDSAMRHRGGDPIASKRRAWVQHLAADAALRRGKPKRVMAFVDVFDRPAVDMELSGLGYSSQTPANLLSKSKEALAAGDLPNELIAMWKTEAERAHAHVGSAKSPAETAFWTERAKTLDVAVDKKGGCCVTQSALSLPSP